MSTAKLLLHCPDTPGILADVTNFFTVNKGNIIYLDQYVDHVENIFYADRVELKDLLARYTAGEWNVEIPLIISNHKDLAHVAERFSILLSFPDHERDERGARTKGTGFAGGAQGKLYRAGTLYASDFRTND